jgi:hypothetical protein
MILNLMNLITPKEATCMSLFKHHSLDRFRLIASFTTLWYVCPPLNLRWLLSCRKCGSSWHSFNGGTINVCFHGVISPRCAAMCCKSRLEVNFLSAHQNWFLFRVSFLSHVRDGTHFLRMAYSRPEMSRFICSRPSRIISPQQIFTETALLSSTTSNIHSRDRDQSLINHTALVISSRTLVNGSKRNDAIRAEVQCGPESSPPYGRWFYESIKMNSIKSSNPNVRATKTRGSTWITSERSFQTKCVDWPC